MWRERERTYKKPSQKIPIIRTLRLKLICSFETTDMGMQRMMTSRAIEMAAVATSKAS